VSFETTSPELEGFFGKKEVLYLFPEHILNLFQLFSQKPRPTGVVSLKRAKVTAH
jgi:hypothetical protein